MDNEVAGVWSGQSAYIYHVYAGARYSRYVWMSGSSTSVMYADVTTYAVVIHLGFLYTGF